MPCDFENLFHFICTYYLLLSYETLSKAKLHKNFWKAQQKTLRNYNATIGHEVR